ncbi:MAG: HEAT repeat domain-containing protein [Polyangiaceae bacterium]
MRLSQFRDPEQSEALSLAFGSLLVLTGRERGLELLTRASAHHAREVRLRILSALPPETSVLRAMASHLASHPSDRRWLRTDVVNAVEPRLREMATSGVATEARAALNYFALHFSREKLAELLEAAAKHRSPQVRLKAHRLLRMHADKERYFAVTRRLLGDDDAHIVRSAIRILCFGRDTEAVPGVVEALSHRSQVVRTTAREGLLALGEDARRSLVHAMNRARPDRRAVIAEVLAAIQETAAAPKSAR